MSKQEHPRLLLIDAWSPDLDGTSSDVPPDPAHFSVFVQMTIGREGERGGEVFELTVASPDKLVPDELGFVPPTLVLNTFSWLDVHSRIEKALEGVRSHSWASIFYDLRHRLARSDWF